MPRCSVSTSSDVTDRERGRLLFASPWRSSRDQLAILDGSAESVDRFEDATRADLPRARFLRDEAAAFAA